MSLNARDLSVDLFARGLTQLKHMLEKAEAHSATRGIDVQALLHGRLATDMYNLAQQVHWAAQGAAIALARLRGVAPAKAAEGETFAALYRQLDATIDSLRAVTLTELEAGLERTIEITHPTGSMTFKGDRFLLEFAIPSFFFHLTSAYAILRHQGVELTKGDFLGRVG